MTLEHISIFLPCDNSFYRRLFKSLSKSFIHAGITVTGGCKLLTESEMHSWLIENKPSAVFEMNRVKNDIPILHDYGVPHITWIVDFQGRTEHQITGSDITYFFDPGWDENYDAGGVQDWLPPGTCTDTFSRLASENDIEVEFSFIGHIPKPWSHDELNRKVVSNTEINFETLLDQYEQRMEESKFEIKTHADLMNIIKDICKKLFIDESNFDINIYYDLMERTKRLKNRVELLSFAKNKSNHIAIYGSENWKEWPDYQDYYRHFVDCPNAMNHIHQTSLINLHDGLSFHFRAIDCMASGGAVFWYDNNVAELYKNKTRHGRGLHDFFDSQSHYYTFRQESFDNVYDNFRCNRGLQNKIRNDAIAIIKTNHTWDHRVAKIINDIESL